MGFRLNLTNEEIKKAQSSDFQPLPEGTYGATIYDAKEATSKAGNDMYVIEYRIDEGPEGIGRKLRGWYVVKANALFSLIDLLKATDNPYPAGKDDVGEFEFPDAEVFLGEKVNIRVVQQAYQSADDGGNEVTKYQNNVKRVYPYDEDKITTEVEETADTGSKKLFL